MKTTHPTKRARLLSKVFLGLLATVGILLVGVFLFARSIKVYSLQVTNITATSATVVWTTEIPTVGGVVVEKGSLNTQLRTLRAYVLALFEDGLFADTRDVKEASPGEYQRVGNSARYTHHVTLTNLEPGAEYVFRPFHASVASASSQLYTFETKPDSDGLSEPMPVYGEVEIAAGSLGDSIIIVQVVERNSLELDRAKSQLVSVPLANGSYVVDVANLYDNSLEEKFPGLLANTDELTLSLRVISKDGQFPFEVSNTNFQPVDTIQLEYFDTADVSENPLVEKIYAKCDSHCVEDCQGCNNATPGDPLCVTYGCGYMSYCCGTGSCEGHCSNGKQDCDETGQDCGGGGCATCGGGKPETSGPCTGSCKSYDDGTCQPVNPVSKNCGCAVNGRKDADESSIDCGGGYCPECTNPGSHCFNALKDQGETGIDCGGACAVSCSTNLGLEMKVGVKCTNNGQVFTCADRRDWNCWCQNGVVSTYHSKEISVITSTTASRVYREALVKLYAKSKFGIHSGMEAGADYQGWLESGQVGYVMNVLSNQGQIDALIEEYKSLPDGVVPIVRFCAGTGCAFADPDDAAAAIEAIAQATGRPVAVISGPNEPLQEYWTVSQNYPECEGTSGDAQIACNTALWMNEFVSKTNDTANVIQLSPDFNTSEDKFESFVALLKQYGADFSDLDGIAGNAYEGAGGKSIAQVVDELKSLFESNDIYITEAGVDPYGANPQADAADNFQKVLDALVAISDDPAVKSMLLFNPLDSLNPDSNFDKHELTDEQMAQMAAALAGTGSTTTISDAPGYVVSQPTSPSGGAYSCNRGVLVNLGSSSCCKGERMSVCVDSSGNAYLDAPEMSDARDTFLRKDGEPAYVVGKNIDDGRHDVGTFSSDFCIQYHVKGDASTPEHEWMCVQKGGGNVGVSGSGNGNRLLEPTLAGTVHAKDTAIEPGVYTVQGVNVDVTTKSIDVSVAGKINYFYDLNENGIFDEGETYLTDGEAGNLEVTFEKSLDVLSYHIIKGWNTLSFPLVMNDSSTSYLKTASDLFMYFEIAGFTTTHVAAYRNQQFIFYSQRVDENKDIRSYGDNFDILPGEAYFLKTYDSGDLSIAGYEVTSSIPVTLNTGWNLVGLYDNEKESLEAFKLLKSMQKDEIPADMLVRWINSRYDGVVLQDDTEYGNDFSVFPTEGYWIRVTTEGGFAGTTFSP